MANGNNGKNCKYTPLYVASIMLIIIIIVLVIYISLNRDKKDRYNDNYNTLQATSSNGSCITIPVKGVNLKLCLNDIINAAKKAWQIYQDGIPVYNINTDYAQALPCLGDGSKCTPPPWNMMENFVSVTAGPFSVKIKSGWPYYKQVYFTYQPIWTCKGNVIVDGQPRGKYISYATIDVTDISSLALNKTDMVCSVAEVFNKGTIENPIAGIHFVIDVQVKNPFFSEKFWKCNIFLYGDGTHQIQVCNAQTPNQAEKAFGMLNVV